MAPAVPGARARIAPAAGLASLPSSPPKPRPRSENCSAAATAHRSTVRAWPSSVHSGVIWVAATATTAGTERIVTHLGLWHHRLDLRITAEVLNQRRQFGSGTGQIGFGMLSNIGGRPSQSLTGLVDCDCDPLGAGLHVTALGQPPVGGVDPLLGFRSRVRLARAAGPQP